MRCHPVGPWGEPGTAREGFPPAAPHGLADSSRLRHGVEVEGAWPPARRQGWAEAEVYVLYEGDDGLKELAKDEGPRWL